MCTDDRATGVLLGLACGDALGRPVEFTSANAIANEHGRLTEMIGDGTWNQPAGTVTDDTDQALCIARSLLDCARFDPEDVATRFVDWYESGPFDVGRMTARSISRLQHGDSWERAGQEVWEASPEGTNAGNGSVMRCPPVAIPYASDPETLVRYSRQSSQITHADPRCTYGCAAVNLTIAGYLTGEDDPLSSTLVRIREDAPNELVTALEPIVADDQPEDLQTSGYVVHTVQTALYDALTADDPEEAIVTAVNRGGDTDTIGAVTGAVAGARFGAEALPDRWLAAIDEASELRRLGAELAAM